MTLADGLILGTVQGLTEFLPVSSSGHLILAREVLGINVAGGLAFDAILQLGTILAVLVYFRQTILNLIRDVLRIVSGRGKDVKKEDRNLLLGLIVGTLPALVFGLLLEKFMDSTFRSATIVAITLILGSILFFIAERVATQKDAHPSVKQSWRVGCFQTLALVPGVSRSGATISGGLILGLTRDMAARLSFLLSIPIITGSGLKKLVDVWQSGTIDATWTILAAGFLTAFLVGLFCIRFLLEYLKRHTLSAFAWYRIALAVIVLILVR
jgi:undecaprenyl-diphosphatase